jgi:hypothetical protein
VQNDWGKCGCTSAADCTPSPDGHQCVNPYNDGWNQCGCASDGDCPTGQTCNAYKCGP